ncbi:uncharacterized protein [Procambarus clarkii]|uniref:uncharacterized protein n=1 Tax=Procambarus clarkii TaxID=6728 RepID=UPI003741F76A
MKLRLVNWWLLVAAAGMVVPAGAQVVPGLANMEILRTVPLIQASGTARDPPSAPLHALTDRVPRRYDVLFDYSNEEENHFEYYDEKTDYSEEEGRLDYSKDSSDDGARDGDEFVKVTATLERPQTLLNTDVTDYAIFTLESINSPDADTTEATAEVFGLGDSLGLENLISVSPSIHKIKPLYSTERMPQGTIERVKQGRPKRVSLGAGERMPLDTAEKVHLGSEKKESKGSEDAVVLGTAEKALQDTGRKLILGTTESDPTRSREQSTLNLRAFSSPHGPQGVAVVGTVLDPQHPLTSSSAARRQLPHNTLVDPNVYYRDGEGSTRNDHTIGEVVMNYRMTDFGDHPAPSRYHPQNARSYYPAGDLPSRTPPEEALPSQQMDPRQGPTNARATLPKATHSGVESSSASPGTLSSARGSRNSTHASTIKKGDSNDAPSLRSVLRMVETRNRDEVMYYTGLQREIEKSDVLVDAIRNVRTREGKMVKSFKRKQSTTTVSPVPDIEEVRNMFGSHPLYDKLPRETSLKNKLPQETSLRNKPGPIPLQEKYDDEEDEYENLYLPVRAKSLELEKINEVKRHFSTLVPKTLYRIRPFSIRPTGSPKITTYKPRYVPSFYTTTKSVTYASKSPSMSSYGKNHRTPKATSLSPPRTSKLVSSAHTQNKRRPSTHLLQGNYESHMHSSSRNRRPIGSRSHDHHRNDNQDNYSPRSQRQKVFKNQSLSIYGPRNHNNKLWDPKDHEPSSLQSERPHSVGDPGSPSTRGYNTPIPVIKPHPKHHSRPFSTSHGTSGDGSSPSRKQANSKYPTSSLYEEADLRPDPEEGARRKKGPDMEAILDAGVSFPRFGYNIDSFFTRFPGFGFFDYDPDKNVPA